MTVQRKSEIENLPEYKDMLSILLNKNIVDIKVIKNVKGEWEVLYFYPHFWWFRKRNRMSYNTFNNLIKNTKH